MTGDSESPVKPLRRSTVTMFPYTWTESTWPVCSRRRARVGAEPVPTASSSEV